MHFNGDADALYEMGCAYEDGMVEDADGVRARSRWSPEQAKHDSSAAAEKRSRGGELDGISTTTKASSP